MSDEMDQIDLIKRVLRNVASAITDGLGASVPPGTLPSPTGLTATTTAASSSGGGTIALSWQAVEGATGYDIATADGAIVTSVTGTSHTLQNVAAGTYSLMVRTTTDTLTGTWSPLVSATVAPYTAPAGPAAPTVTGSVTNRVLTLNWNADPDYTAWEVHENSTDTTNTLKGTYTTPTRTSGTLSLREQPLRYGVRGKKADGTFGPWSKAVFVVIRDPSANPTSTVTVGPEDYASNGDTTPPVDPGPGTGGLVDRVAGVGGVRKAIDGVDGTVITATADSTSELIITTGGQAGNPRIYEGNGKTIGRVTFKAQHVIVQNFNIRSRSQYGVVISDGANNVVLQNCDIKDVRKSGDGDLNAITLYGASNVKILYNTAVNYVSGDPGGSHTDCLQTWVSSSHPSPANNVEIVGNVFKGPHNPSRNSSTPSIHQIIMVESAGRGGNSGGSGTPTNWKITDNTFLDSWNQAIKLDNGNNFLIARNKFEGSSDKVFQLGGSGNVVYSSNQFGSGYSSIGASVTAGDGPANPHGRVPDPAGGGAGGNGGGATTPPPATTAGKPTEVLPVLLKSTVTLPIGGTNSPTNKYPTEYEGDSSVTPWFWSGTDANGPYVGFKVKPASVVTTANSKYGRSEGREMADTSWTKAAWSSSGPKTLKARLSIDTSKLVTRKRCNGLQIHDGSDDVMQIMRHESNGLGVMYNDGGSWLSLQPAYAGEVFDCEINVSGNTVTVKYNTGKADAKTVSFSKTGSGWYWKYGCYSQTGGKSEHTEPASAETEVRIYSLTLS